MNAADAKTDSINLVTRTSPAPGAAVARPLAAPALVRQRGRGYELAPPSPRDLIARSNVPVLPAAVRAPVNRADRRRSRRPVQRVGSVVAALLAAPLLASALPAGQLAASAGPTVATTTTTTTTATGGLADPAATTDPSATTTSVDGAATSTTAGTTTTTVDGATTADATTAATAPGSTPAATTTLAPPSATSTPTTAPATTTGTTTAGRPGATTTTAAGSTTTAAGSTTTTTVDPSSTTTTTTVPVAAATTALPVGEVVLPPLGTTNDPIAVGAAQAIVQRHADDRAQDELLWTQTAREAADQEVARLTAVVADLSGQAFTLSAGGQSTFAVERDRAVAQVALDDARRNAGTMALRQASAAAVADQSAAAYTVTRRAIADAVALRAGVDAAQLDARWATTSPARLDVMFAALAQIGDPYIWGATGPDTFDCSGLTGFAWKAAGVTLPHYTVTQRQTTLDVAEADVQPGDLVFNLDGPNGGHVMMFLGVGHAIVEAPGTGLEVRVSNWRAVTGFGSPLDDRTPAVGSDVGTTPAAGTTGSATPGTGAGTPGI